MADGGYESEADAAAARQSVVNALNNLKASRGDTAATQARQQLEANGLKWPIPKVKAIYALRLIETIANPSDGSPPPVEW
jgi:hypothetical protein